LLCVLAVPVVAAFSVAPTIVVLWRETCQHRLAYTLALGERVGLAETAGGLSLLAWRDPSSWEGTLRSGGVADAEAIADTVRQLRAIRAGAVAVCVNGHVREVSSLAVPLLNSLGECVAALSVAIPTSRLDPAKQEAIEGAQQEARAQVFR
jgi:DNA-binding IclR family transcriptional regulator